MSVSERTRVYSVTDKKLGLGFEGLLKDKPPTMEYTGYVLPVTFADQGFALPILTVNPKEPKDKHISIAFFNPLREDLAEAAATDMTDLTLSLGIEADRPILFIGPATNKSKGLSELVKDKFQEKTKRNDKEAALFMFPGGEYTEADDGRHVILPDFPDKLIAPDKRTGIFKTTDEEGLDVIGICYKPITGKLKYICLDEYLIQNLGQFLEQHQGVIVLLEDVVTTLATIKTMKTMLVKFCGAKEEKIYTVAAAYEGNQPCPDPTVRHVIQLPEWIGTF